MLQWWNVWCFQGTKEWQLAWPRECRKSRQRWRLSLVWKDRWIVVSELEGSGAMDAIRTKKCLRHSVYWQKGHQDRAEKCGLLGKRGSRGPPAGQGAPTHTVRPSQPTALNTYLFFKKINLQHWERLEWEIAFIFKQSSQLKNAACKTLCTVWLHFQNNKEDRWTICKNTLLGEKIIE